MFRDWLYADVRSRRRTISNLLRWRLRLYVPHALKFQLHLVNRFSRRPVLGPRTAPAVSLTSYGSRIETVHLTIESIARGTDRPSSITLWLDDADAVENLPAALRRLQKRGLAVYLTDNLGPHTKYYPQVRSMAGSESDFVTADDDIIYPRWWLRGLIQESRRYPDHVLAYRAYEITLSDGAIRPYLEWAPVLGQRTGPRLIATGVSGVLYPEIMAKHLIMAGDEFKSFAPSADDLWIHWVTLRAGIPVRQISRVPLHFWITPTSQGMTLMSENLEGGNDSVVARLYDREVVKLLSDEGQDGELS